MFLKAPITCNTLSTSVLWLDKCSISSTTSSARRKARASQAVMVFCLTLLVILSGFFHTLGSYCQPFVLVLFPLLCYATKLVPRLRDAACRQLSFKFSGPNPLRTYPMPVHPNCPRPYRTPAPPKNLPKEPKNPRK